MMSLYVFQDESGTRFFVTCAQHIDHATSQVEAKHPGQKLRFTHQTPYSDVVELVVASDPRRKP